VAVAAKGEPDVPVAGLPGYVLRILIGEDHQRHEHVLEIVSADGVADPDRQQRLSLLPLDPGAVADALHAVRGEDEPPVRPVVSRILRTRGEMSMSRTAPKAKGMSA
jgi:hypothetical protein